MRDSSALKVVLQSLEDTVMKCAEKAVWMMLLVAAAASGVAPQSTNVEVRRVPLAEARRVIDAYANTYFYSDNTSYNEIEILRQKALPGLEGHISYSCTPNLWVSLDTRYSFRGDTVVNGTDQNNAQQNFTLGSELNALINPRNLLVFKFAMEPAHKNGPAYTGFSLEYIFSWAKGYK